MRLILGNPVPTHLEAYYDEVGNIIHVLDLDKGRTVTNAISNIHSLVREALKLPGKSDFYIWYLYGTDGMLVGYKPAEDRFYPLSQEDSEAHPAFMEVMRDRQSGLHY